MNSPEHGEFVGLGERHSATSAQTSLELKLTDDDAMASAIDDQSSVPLLEPRSSRAELSDEIAMSQSALARLQSELRASIAADNPDDLLLIRHASKRNRKESSRTDHSAL